MVNIVFDMVVEGWMSALASDNKLSKTLIMMSVQTNPDFSRYGDNNIVTRYNSVTSHVILCCVMLCYVM